MPSLALAALLALSAPAPAQETGPSELPDQITLYAIPAPRPLGITWRKPGPLIRRTMVNEGFGLPRGIGHAGVRVECAATEERPAAHFQGSMTSTGPEFEQMILEEKAGMGILFRVVPGRLETEEELQATLDRRYDNGRMSWLRVGISPETCHGLLDYVEAYREAHVGDLYGFVRPLHAEGAGCSAFSMSFLELAGLVEPFMEEEWTFDVLIHEKHIGGKTNPDRRLGVLRLLFTMGAWARPDQPHLHLNGWEPTHMFRDLRERALAAEAAGEGGWERQGDAVGLVWDRRDAQPHPALTSGTFFVGEPEWESPDRWLTVEP